MKTNRQGIRVGRLAGIVLVALISLSGMVLGFLTFLRPEKSMTEARVLARLPQATAETVLDGTYCSDLAKWYADTYPFRDAMLAVDKKIKRAYGLAQEGYFVGGNVVGDEIPDGPINAGSGEEAGGGEQAVGDTDEQASGANTAAGAALELGIKIYEGIIGNSAEGGAQNGGEEESEQLEAEILARIKQGFYVKGDAAYTIYYFSQKNADRYIAALNSAAQRLAGTTTIYSALVPNSSNVLLSKKEVEVLGGSDESKAISYYYDRYKGVIPIRASEILKRHSDEYLFFRTDHHWTQRGAYYAYEDFCNAKGIVKNQLSSYENVSFGSFLGSIYRIVGSAEMEKKPDTVEAFMPKGTNDMYFTDKNGKQIKWRVINDVSNWKANAKYSCFIGGDNPYSIIENPNISDGSSCLVVKESYGNPFVPFLVDHYQTVHVMDFRYYNGSVVDFALENKIEDLIIMNNTTIIGGSGAVDKIVKILQ